MIVRQTSSLIQLIHINFQRFERPSTIESNKIDERVRGKKKGGGGGGRNEKMFESRPPIYSCKFKPDSAKVFSSWWQISTRATNSSEKFLNGCPHPPPPPSLPPLVSSTTKVHFGGGGGGQSGGNDDTIRSRIKIKHFPGVSQNELSFPSSFEKFNSRKEGGGSESFSLIYLLSIIYRCFILNRPRILNIGISLLNEFIKFVHLPILFELLFRNSRIEW